MKSHDFIIGPTDTDSISFCKADQSAFNPEELKALLQEIKSLSPEFMEWEDDGLYQSCVVLRAKNYVLFDGKKKTVKGSAFKTSTKEVALGQMMQEIVDAMLTDRMGDINEIYHKYILEAMNVQDITRWCQKKTVTRSVLDCKDYTEQDILDKKVRRNETVIWDALGLEEGVQEGDKIYLYPVIMGEKVTEGGVSEKTGKKLKDKVKVITGVRLAKYFAGDHDVEKLIKRVYSTLKIFALVLDMDDFINYGTKKNKQLLEQLAADQGKEWTHGSTEKI